MSITRRRFLSMLAAAPVVAVAARTWFLPPPGGWVGKKNWLYNRQDGLWYPDWESAENVVEYSIPIEITGPEQFNVHRNVIELIERRMNEAANSVVDGMARKLFDPNRGMTDDGYKALGEKLRLTYPWPEVGSPAYRSRG